MSTTTVRTMLSVILENEMQMDDEICIALSPNAIKKFSNFLEMEHVKTEVWKQDNRKYKTLAFVFDLANIQDEE